MNRIQEEYDWRQVTKRIILTLAFVLAYSLVATRLVLAQNYAVLYSFTGGPNGGEPTSGLIKDPTGNLYGTTSGGGDFGNGTVFEFSTTGKENVRSRLGGQPLRHHDNRRRFLRHGFQA
jgi:uncharacterized repeat protein (TIGR03803 family)